jgi:hypothetical protein
MEGISRVGRMFSQEEVFEGFGQPVEEQKASRQPGGDQLMQEEEEE